MHFRAITGIMIILSRIVFSKDWADVAMGHKGCANP